MIRNDGSLVLLTSRDLAEDSLLLAADFRDMQALIHTPTGKWVGMNQHGVRLGSGPLEMIDGIWYVKESSDPEYQNTRLSGFLSFEVIG